MSLALIQRDNRIFLIDGHNNNRVDDGFNTVRITDVELFQQLDVSGQYFFSVNSRF